MKRYIAILAGIVVVVGLATPTMALQSQGSSERPSVGRPSTGGRTSPSAGSTSSPSTSSSSGGSYRPAGVSRPGRSDQSPGGGGGTPPVPVQSYSPNRHFDYGCWYDTNFFIYQLFNRYRYLSAYDYLWRYAQDDSPLTQEIVNLALSESSLAADSLIATASELESLIDEYEAGTMGQKSFEVEVERTTKRIRDLSKQIRKDHLLGYLDQSPTTEVPSYDSAKSVSELRELCQELNRAATAIANGIDAYYERDMTRTVNVNDLQRPSFGTMTKEVDRLAKTISKSADRL